MRKCRQDLRKLALNDIQVCEVVGVTSKVLSAGHLSLWRRTAHNEASLAYVFVFFNKDRLGGTIDKSKLSADRLKNTGLGPCMGRLN